MDIIINARDGEVDVPRKVAKALWIIAGKNKDILIQKFGLLKQNKYIFRRLLFG